MRHLKRAIFIMLLMASLMTISACGSGNQAYPNPDEYPYPYTTPDYADVVPHLAHVWAVRELWHITPSANRSRCASREAQRLRCADAVGHHVHAGLA